MNNIVSIDDQKRFKVVKDTEFILNLVNDLNLIELKIVEFAISKIKPTDTELSEIETTISDFCKVMGFAKGGDTYKSVRNALIGLQSKPVTFQAKDENNVKFEQITSWIGYSRIYDGGKIVLKLAEGLEIYLLNVIKKGYYTQYYLGDIACLNSRYAIILYQSLVSQLFKRDVIFTVEEIQTIFDKPTWQFYRLNDRYLKKAVSEINEKTNLQIDYDTLKKGNKTVSIRFFLNYVKVPRVPLHNWLEEDGNE